MKLFVFLIAIAAILLIVECKDEGKDKGNEESKISKTTRVTSPKTTKVTSPKTTKVFSPKTTTPIVIVKRLNEDSNN